VYGQRHDVLTESEGFNRTFCLLELLLHMHPPQGTVLPTERSIL
jgi:hypothetical protein